MKLSRLRPYFLRFGIVFIFSLLTVVLISEIGIRLQRENTARAPQTIELVIPNGTAEKLALGVETTGIPSEMGFVMGDILLVRNLDSVAHTLGPLLIPPDTSAQMPLNEAENLAVSCSFTPSKYLGIDVRTPTTFSTRMTAFFFAVPPTTVMFFIYSLIAFPVVGKREDFD